jgi:hypothetical protein
MTLIKRWMIFLRSHFITGNNNVSAKQSAARENPGNDIERISGKINCFLDDPSIKSSLKFLRKTEWARKKVEDLYVEMIDAKS